MQFAATVTADHFEHFHSIPVCDVAGGLSRGVSGEYREAWNCYFGVASCPEGPANLLTVCSIHWR